MKFRVGCGLCAGRLAAQGSKTGAYGEVWGTEFCGTLAPNPGGVWGTEFCGTLARALNGSEMGDPML